MELPKGAYVISFHHRAIGGTKANGNGTTQREIVAPAAKEAVHRPRVAVIALTLALVISLVTIAALVKGRRTPDTTLAARNPPVPLAFEVFWKPFLTWPEEPDVVFSNAAFIGRPETGMRYFDSGRDSRDRIWDHYTGVGEVFAVHNLDSVFNLFHRGIRVKRGSLFSLDDAKNNDLIFVGSPSENLTLMDIPGTREFVFQRLDSGPRKGDLAIVNVHPEAGEMSSYVATPSNQPLTEDYAVIGLVPGMDPARSVLIVAGTTTFGTQGGVEFICTQSSLEELLSRLSVSKIGELKPFEALLRVKVARGVPVGLELVSVRKRIP